MESKNDEYISLEVSQGIFNHTFGFVIVRAITGMGALRPVIGQKDQLLITRIKRYYFSEKIKNVYFKIIYKTTYAKFLTWR